MKLPHFHKILLIKMLWIEADERPNFLELKEILDSPSLAINLNNKDYINGLVGYKGTDRKRSSLKGSEYYSSVNPQEKKLSDDANLLFTKAYGRATFQIKKMQNNVTKLICGAPDFEP